MSHDWILVLRAGQSGTYALTVPSPWKSSWKITVFLLAFLPPSRDRWFSDGFHMDVAIVGFTQCHSPESPFLLYKPSLNGRFICGFTTFLQWASPKIIQVIRPFSFWKPWWLGDPHLKEIPIDGSLSKQLITLVTRGLSHWQMSGLIPVANHWADPSSASWSSPVLSWCVKTQ